MSQADLKKIEKVLSQTTGYRKKSKMLNLFIKTLDIVTLLWYN